MSTFGPGYHSRPSFVSGDQPPPPPPLPIRGFMWCLDGYKHPASARANREGDVTRRAACDHNCPVPLCMSFGIHWLPWSSPRAGPRAPSVRASHSASYVSSRFSFVPFCLSEFTLRGRQCAAPKRARIERVSALPTQRLALYLHRARSTPRQSTEGSGRNTLRARPRGPR